MQDRISELLKALEKGEITAEQFKREHERELERIGEEAKNASGDTVTQQRVHDIAEKIAKL